LAKEQGSNHGRSEGQEDEDDAADHAASLSAHDRPVIRFGRRELL